MSECSVYIIGCPFLNPQTSVGSYAVKVGIAHNPNYRLLHLQTGNPHRLSLDFEFIFDRREIARQVERRFHFRTDYASHKIGEWFELEWKQALYFLTIDVSASLEDFFDGGGLSREREKCGLYRAFDVLDSEPQLIRDKHEMLETWRRNY